MSNSKADALYFEIADAMDLLDNVTADYGSEDSLGQAELALTRAREILVDQGMLRIFAEAPAMVEALRNLLSDMEHLGIIDFYDQDLNQGISGAVFDARAILSRIDGAGDTLPDMPEPAPTGEERARPRTQWALTIIRKNWEPRFSVYPTEEDVRLDLLGYAREVLDLEVSDLADIAELADRIGEDGRDQVYWGPAGPC